MTRTFQYFVVIACSLTFAVAGEPKHTYMPPAGYVPDEATATKIDVAVWEPIAAEKPYCATLHNGVWTVTGSLASNTPGGLAIAEISKVDGRIIRISHAK